MTIYCQRILILAVFLFGLNSASSFGQSANNDEIKDKIENAKRATFAVGYASRETRSAGKKGAFIPLQSTGFFINNNGLFITSRHNIPLPLKEGDKIFIYQSRSEGKGYSAWSSNIVLDLPDLDLIVVQFPPAISESVSWLGLSHVEARQGEELTSISFRDKLLEITNTGAISFNPGVSLAPKISKSIVTNIDARTLKNGAGSNLVDKRVIETDMDFVTGITGSPLISDKSGQVVGLISDYSMSVRSMYSVFSPKRKRDIFGVDSEMFIYGISIDEVMPRLISAGLISDELF